MAIAHRASILQAFHSGISESQRKANIEAHQITNTPTTVTVGADESGHRSKPAGQLSGRGVVRTISSKQVKFILSLIKSRDLSNLNILPGQTIDPAKVHTMGIKGGSALIEKLLNCPELPKINAVRMPSTAQLNLMRSKNAQAGYPVSETDINTVTFAEVNEFLTHMNTIIDSRKKEIQATITEGAYWYNGLIARVQKSRNSNHLYAKLQKHKDSKEFIFIPGLINQLKKEDMLSLDDMKMFAQQYACCADCGRNLTNPESVERGVGPICFGKGYTR